MAISKRDIFSILLTIFLFSAVTAWQYCIFTFCKTTSYPEWLQQIYDVFPAFGMDAVFSAALLLLGFFILNGKFKHLLVIVFLTPAFVSAVKHLPRTEPEYLMMNLLYDYAFVFIVIVIPASVCYAIKRMIGRVSLSRQKDLPS